MSNSFDINAAADDAVESWLSQWDTERTERKLAAIKHGKPTESLEYDILLTPEILEKVRGDDLYAQHLYAALCNTDWQYRAIFPVLKNERWNCSWRYAGGLIAEIRGYGDYMDWYCSGITPDVDVEAFNAMTEDQKEHYLKLKAYHGEGVVSDEIRRDLKNIGWVCIAEGGDDSGY